MTATRARTIIAAELGIPLPSLADENSFADHYGCDEIDLYEIAFALEREFGINIDDADLEQVGTVGDFLRLVERKTEAAHA